MLLSDTLVRDGMSDVVVVVVVDLLPCTSTWAEPYLTRNHGLVWFWHTVYCYGTLGGVKLGAGGLIRAYGAAARQVLREAPVDVLIPKSTFRVSVTPEYVGAIYDSVAKAGGTTGGEEFATDGTLSVTVTCDLESAETLRKGLIDATRGTATFLNVHT